MDIVSRLIVWVLAVVVVMPAAAADCTQYRMSVTAGGLAARTVTIIGQWSSSIAAASASLESAAAGVQLQLSPGYEANNSHCSFGLIKASDGRVTGSGTTCYTKSGGWDGYTESAAGIESRTGNYCGPTCTGGDVLGSSSSKWYWKGSGSTTCQGGCLYIADTFAHDKTSGYSVGWGKLNGLGVACTTGNESAGETPPDNKPPNRCEPGKCPGTVNGVSVCVKCGGKTGAVDEKAEEKTTDPDGEGGQEGETTTTKTTTKTTCDEGQCETETTTTTTGPGGTKTETTKDTESEDSFCQKNPTHKLCKETESEFGGSCQGGFRCEGDAVQCAIAREQHQRMCQLLDTETDLSLLGKRLGTGQEDGSIRDQLGAGAAPLDVSSHLGNAPALGPTSGCPADVSVGQYVLPFSKLCGQLNTLGNALVGFAWLVAAFIVFRKGAD